MKKSKSPVTSMTLRQLGRELGIDHGQLSRESRRDGFPSRRRRGRRTFDAAAVAAWREQNIVQRNEAEPAGQKIDASDPSILALSDGTMDALKISRHAVQLAARRVSDAAVAGTLSASAMDSLKKSLQELRAAEGAYLILGEKSGALMPREDCDNSVRYVVGICIQLMERLENEIGGQVNRWMADSAFLVMDSETRSRVVREFTSKVIYDERFKAADGLKKFYEGVEREKNS